MLTPKELTDIPSEIDTIIYSDSSKEEKLERLRRYVSVGDKMSEFQQRNGFMVGTAFGSGPGVKHWIFFHCGLELVSDPDEVIRVIRRGAKVVDGKPYEACSISNPVFSWKGYQRLYPD